MNENNNWYCYLLVGFSEKNTYIGATTDVNRRLRQHNGELCGGAKEHVLTDHGAYLLTLKLEIKYQLYN